jgi:hypothetical protein
MSIVQVHLDEIMYQNDDQIVCFFAFSQIGIVVPLRPGDTLMFNPQKPHCISSHCNKDDIIYRISSYMKTQVVGLNDNSDKVIQIYATLMIIKMTLMQNLTINGGCHL